MAKLTYGSAYFSGTPVETTLVADTPAKAAGDTTAMQLSGFTMPAHNRLTYTDATTRVFSVTFAGSMFKGSGTGSDVTMYLYKNGSVIPGGWIDRRVPGSDTGAFAVTAQVSLDQDDYVELWVANDSGDDISVVAGAMTVAVLG